MLFLGEHLRLPPRVIRGVSGRAAAALPGLDVIGGKPRRQFLGEGAPTLGLNLYLHVEQIPPRPTYAALRQLMAEGHAFQLWNASGGYWGTYVIDSVDHRVVWALPGGQWIAVAVDVSLVDPGEERPAPRVRPPGVRAYVGPTITSPPPEDLSRSPGEVPLAEVARL